MSGGQSRCVEGFATATDEIVDYPPLKIPLDLRVLVLGRLERGESSLGRATLLMGSCIFSYIGVVNLLLQHHSILRYRFVYCLFRTIMSLNFLKKHCKAHYFN